MKYERMDWGNHLEKKSDPKSKTNSRKQNKIAACEQKKLSRKRIYAQTPISCFT